MLLHHWQWSSAPEYSYSLWGKMSVVCIDKKCGNLGVGSSYGWLGVAFE